MCYFVWPMREIVNGIYYVMQEDHRTMSDGSPAIREGTNDSHPH